MNGVLELADTTKIRRSLADDTNELMNIPEEDEEAWDERSFSDSGSDCSCSTCSTCSLCDECDPEEAAEGEHLYPSSPETSGNNRFVYQNARGHTHGNQRCPDTESVGSNSSNSAYQTRRFVGFNDMNGNGAYIRASAERTEKRNTISQVHFDNGNTKSNKIIENKKRMFRLDCYSSDDSSQRIAIRNLSEFHNNARLECNFVRPPSYVTDSSGSEKEVLPSKWDKCKADRADSSSELSSSGYSEGGGKERRKKKKVTFMETSLLGSNGTSSGHRSDQDMINGFGNATMRQPVRDGASIDHWLTNSTRQTIGSSNLSSSRRICNGASNGLPVSNHSWDTSSEQGSLNGNKVFFENKGESRNVHREHKVRLHQVNGVEKRDGDLSAEYIRLRYVLDHIDPYKLHTVLRHQLKRKNKGVVSALGLLLPRATFTAETVHCVRCHKEYNPKYGKTSCTLPHPPQAIIRVSQEGDEATFRCTVCGHEFSLIGCWDDQMNIEKHSGHCFVGGHTPRPDEVRYVPSGPAISCVERGCIEFYV